MAKLSIFFSLYRRITAMNGLCVNETFRSVAYPTENVFYWLVFVECHAYDVFEAFSKIFCTLDIFLFGEGLNLIYSIEGKGKYFLPQIRNL